MPDAPPRRNQGHAAHSTKEIKNESQSQARVLNTHLYCNGASVIGRQLCEEGQPVTGQKCHQIVQEDETGDQMDVREKIIPVSRKSRQHKQNKKGQGNIAKRLFEHQRNLGQAMAYQKAQNERQAQDQEDIDEHIQGIQIHFAQNACGGFVHATKESQIEWRKKHSEGRGYGRHANGQSGIAAGEMSKKVGQIAARTGSHEHHTQGHAGMRFDQAHHKVGESGQEDELGKQTNHRCPRTAQHCLKSRKAQVQSNAKHNQSQNDVQGDEGGRIEIKLDLIDGSQVRFLAYFYLSGKIDRQPIGFNGQSHFPPLPAGRMEIPPVALPRTFR